MKFVYDLQGNSEIVRDLPVFGNGAAINVGAVVMRGATPGTNTPFAILGAPTYPDVLGVMEEPHAAVSAGTDSSVDGVYLTRRKIIINPLAVFRAEYDQSTLLTVASTSGTTVTITSLEDDIDGGWLYAVSGTGLGQLQFIATSASGSCTTKTATGWDSTTRVIKIHPIFHQLVDLTTTGDKVKSAAGAGTGSLSVVDVLIEADSIPIQVLNPTVHSGLTGLNSLNVKFYADVVFRNHAFNTLD